MSYLLKSKEQIFNEALRKIQVSTPITSTSPGSVARAITEAFAQQLGDMYGVLDFNVSQTFISTAQGRSLDLIGDLYGVQRKTLSNTAAMDKSLGVFYFYTDNPAPQDITIPAGTTISTSTDGNIGLSFDYVTTEEVTIPVGRTRVYASIRPLFTDSMFTAGIGTVTVISSLFIQPTNATVKATNPKQIQAQVGYEDDDSYRTRIVKQIRTASGGTMEAMRFAGLGVNGVRDVMIREAPYGLGSFEAIVVAEDNLINGPVLVAATNAMQAIRPAGVRMFVRQPDLLPVDVHASIILRTNVTVDANDIARRTEIGILRFLNKPLVGTALVYNQLIQAIMDATDVVTDVTITKLAVNGVEILRKNYTPESDQQIIPGEIQVSTA
jgi:uncharacterized phage protein gp47/JayE